MPARISWPLALGAASGALSAGATFIPLGRVASPWVFGRCLGFSMASACDGIDLSYYLFPGLIFGAVFAGLLRRRRRIGAKTAAAFAVGAVAANAVAVFVCLAIIDPLQNSLITSDIGIAISGAIAGALGGFLLAEAARRLFPGASLVGPAVAGALLGLVVVAMAELQAPGVFVFYIIWQAGYGAALTASLPEAA